jgi:hypothetical protein
MGGLFGRLSTHHCVTSQAKNADIADWFRLPRGLPVSPALTFAGCAQLICPTF